MFNCIGSEALFTVCTAIGLPSIFISHGSPMEDVYIVNGGDALDTMNYEGMVAAYKLSDYLLATAPVDVEAR